MSTCDAVFALLKDVYSRLDLSDSLLCLFYDMTKAFDLLNHSVLLHKLRALGIAGKSLLWIFSYLKDRSFIVSLKNLDNDNVLRTYRSVQSPPINIGVPQGSNLGPILFLLYVNDLPHTLSAGKVWLFADDICHLIGNSDRNVLINSTQTSLNEMSNWCNDNCLILNTEKTKLVDFYNRKKPEPPQHLNLNGTPISTCEEVKYLGLHITENLSWDNHVESLSARLTPIIYLIYRLQKLVGTEILLKVYYGCFHSLISYGVVFWGGSPAANRIFLLQKRIVRRICGATRLAHCKPLFKELGILTLPSLFILESAILVRKNPDVFVANNLIHRYNTRRANNVHMPQISSTLAGRSPYYSSARIFNKLPKAIIMEPNLEKFKGHLKDYLCEAAYYNLEEMFSVAD